jgi:hypothetical protein
MNLTIEIPDALEAVLKTKAHDQGVNPSGYARQVLERDLRSGGPKREPNERPIWEVILDHAKTVPPEAFEKLPKDGASQVDHYLYGHPKR